MYIIPKFSQPNDCENCKLEDKCKEGGECLVEVPSCIDCYFFSQEKECTQNPDCKELDARFGVCLTGKNADGVNFAPHIYVESKKPFNPHKKESTRGGNMQKETTFSDVDLKLDKNPNDRFNRPMLTGVDWGLIHSAENLTILTR